MQTKKCTSCKRNLTYENFGFRKTTSDGYSNTCKACCNWHRRQSYKRAKKGLTHRPNRQVPLKEANYVALSKAIPVDQYGAAQVDAQLAASDVNVDIQYTVSISKTDTAWVFSVYDHTHDSKVLEVYHQLTIPRDWLISESVHILVHREIKINKSVYISDS